jgi:DNA-3-methyladenine glycosylase I
LAIEPTDSALENKCYRVQDAMNALVQEYTESVTLICPPTVDIGLTRKALIPLAEETGKHVTILIGEGMDVCEPDDTLVELLSRKRCAWADTPLLAYYHDFEWGRMPCQDSEWFEFITLEIFQAGLSWKTILRKRIEFRKAFREFDIQEIARYTDEDIAMLLQNQGIVRNKKKLAVTVENAQIAMGLREIHGSLNKYIREVCLHEDEHKILKILSDTFRFVGPTTAESIANATGLIAPNHDEDCFMCK